MEVRSGAAHFPYPAQVWIWWPWTSCEHLHPSLCSRCADKMDWMNCVPVLRQWYGMDCAIKQTNFPSYPRHHLAIVWLQKCIVINWSNKHRQLRVGTNAPPFTWSWEPFQLANSDLVIRFLWRIITHLKHWREVNRSRSSPFPEERQILRVFILK